MAAFLFSDGTPCALYTAVEEDGPCPLSYLRVMKIGCRLSPPKCSCGEPILGYINTDKRTLICDNL